MEEPISKKVIRLSDDSMFYEYDTAEQVYHKLRAIKMPVSDAILMLLYAQDKPIYGRTSLMKQVFMLVNEPGVAPRKLNCPVGAE